MKYFSLGQQWVLFVLAFFLVSGLAFRFYPYSPPPLPRDPLEEVVVEVSGEVRQPGVYLYRNRPELKAAIERAGGLKENALFDPTSSSTILETGTLLTVTKEGAGNEIKITIGRMAAHKLLVFSLPLDLNRLSVEDLCLVPGIGESLAREMITYREKRKGFRSVEDLRNVRGIGEKKYRALRKFFAVRS